MNEKKKFTVVKVGEQKLPNLPPISLYEVLIESNGVMFGTRLQSQEEPQYEGVRDFLKANPKAFWIEVEATVIPEQKKRRRTS